MFLGFYFNGRFDGVLNLHFVEKVSLIEVLFDQLVNFVSLVLILFLTALAFGAKGTRFIDVAGTIALALIPFSIAPLLNVNSFFYKTSMVLGKTALEGGELDLQTNAVIGLAVITFILLVLMVWTVALLFNAYKTSTNLKSGKLVGSFITGLVLAIVVSIYITRNFSLQ